MTVTESGIMTITKYHKVIIVKLRVISELLLALEKFTNLLYYRTAL